MLIILLFVWGISALVAGAVASDRERSFLGFAVITFFFLGPLGPGFALVAAHGQIEKVQLRRASEADPFRQRFTCPRCRAKTTSQTQTPAMTAGDAPSIRRSGRGWGGQKPRRQIGLRQLGSSSDWNTHRGRNVQLVKLHIFRPFSQIRGFLA